MRNSADNEWISVWTLKSLKPSSVLTTSGSLADKPCLLLLLCLLVRLSQIYTYNLFRAPLPSHFLQEPFSSHPACRHLHPVCNIESPASSHAGANCMLYSVCDSCPTGTVSSQGTLTWHTSFRASSP